MNKLKTLLILLFVGILLAVTTGCTEVNRDPKTVEECKQGPMQLRYALSIYACTKMRGCQTTPSLLYDLQTYMREYPQCFRDT